MSKKGRNIKEVFHSVGLFYRDEIVYPIPYDADQYQLKDDDLKIRAHIDFLLNLEGKEEKRLESIDSKTSQLIAQTGIIFSLLGLFIPIIMDKAAAFDITIKVFLMILLLLAFLFYLLTIHNALKNYRISGFKYSKPSASNVLDFKDKKIEEFHAEQVRDLLKGIKKNTYNNNRKGTNLLHSYQAFKVANYMTGILVGLFSISILFLPQEKKSISIEGPVEIKKIDSVILGVKKIDADLITIKQSNELIYKKELKEIPLKK